MKKAIFKYVYFWLLVSLFSFSYNFLYASSKSLNKKVIITDITITSNGKNNIYIKASTKGRSPYKFFSLKSPDRIIVDFYNARFLKKNFKVNKLTKDSFIKNIRFSFFKNKTRMVLDVTNVILSLSLKKINKKKKNIFEFITFVSYNPKLSSSNNPKYKSLDDLLDLINKNEFNANLKKSFPNNPYLKVTKYERKKKKLSKKILYANSPSNVISEDTLNNIINDILKGSASWSAEKKLKNLRKARLSSYKNKIIIVIDPGHGGKDSGALGSRLKEKFITLSFSKSLKKKLSRFKKFKVFLTRETDKYIPLRERTAFARKVNADVFISIHADSARNKKARGLTIYTISSKGLFQEQSRVVKHSDKYNYFKKVKNKNKEKDIYSMLVSLTQKFTVKRSNLLALSLQKQLSKVTLVKKEGHRVAAFAVLKSINVPSTLIELGYISNKKDERLLASRRHKKKVTESIAVAIKEYFK